MTATELSPGLTLIVGSALIPALHGRVRAAWLVLLPLLGMAHLALLATGDHGVVGFLGQRLVTLRVDRWSLLFGWIFMGAAWLSAVYALHLKSPLQPAAGLAYAGSAIGAVFAGDLLTLFVFWELTAVTSVLLVWAGGRGSAYRAGMRYLGMQVASGVLLFGGAVMQMNATGSIAFDAIGLAAPGGWLIFLAFGIKCAFPLLHAWLPDAYPEASEVGTVFLSAFTTKLAVYALARGYAGTELLIPIGAAMVVFPIVYAVIENDLRRVLAYSLNNQLGFMVVGIGIGTELALNGAAAHAVTHILYKSLLFMTMGAVLLRVGSVKATEIGGLAKSMPWTAAACVVGAASIAGLPLFSGFVSKSMIVSAAGHEGQLLAWGSLLLASAIALHPDVKVPWAAFFGRDAGLRVAEAPRHMLVAMGVAAFLCVAIGVFPGLLYAWLPHPVDYRPWTAAHVLTQLQLLVGSALVLAWLVRRRLYPRDEPSVNRDVDAIVRGPVAALLRATAGAWRRAGSSLGARLASARIALRTAIERSHGHGSLLAGTWPTGAMALWVLLLLLGYLLLYYL